MGRDQHNLQFQATALGNLGLTLFRLGAYAPASARSRESLALAWELGDQRVIAYMLQELGRVAGAAGRFHQAARLLGAGMSLTKILGVTWPVGYRQELGEQLAEFQAELGADAWTAAWTAGRAMTIEQAVVYAQEEPDQ